MMTDPIADMLTRIRNAGKAEHKWVDMPVSTKKVEIARLLEESHFVHAHKVLEDGRFGVLRVYLKYYDGKPVIRHLKRVSRPGRRHYVRKDAIPRVRNGLGIAIMSTSVGVLSDRTARAKGVGGEVLALVW
ncbi:MAG: 30S ribosomal protein S8 [Gemmatimonadetes bacterium]|nr:30S ribosomal protein S8 [Gemmatimonadota bacterium]MDA1104799.1 30S ribosomal protein S8 [Gemmatimonadota bacterium]